MARGDLTKALLLSLVGGMLLALVSCGSSSGGGEVAGADVGRKKSLDDFQYNKTDVVYGKAGTETEGMIVGGRRSNFEGKRQVVFGGDFEGKSYGTNQYKSKSWNGTKNYGRKNFSGNTDASRFKTASAMGDQTARDAGKQSRYGRNAYETSIYSTPSAREGRAPAVRRDASPYSDDFLPLGKVMTKREYERMTIQETNSLLGRDR